MSTNKFRRGLLRGIAAAALGLGALVAVGVLGVGVSAAGTSSPTPGPASTTWQAPTVGQVPATLDDVTWL